MRLSAVRVIAIGVAAALGVATVAPPAYAIKQFYAELKAKYLKPKSQKQNDVALVIAFEQAECTICHPGDDKHRLTRYGGQVSARINKFDKEDKKKIRAALEEVGALRSNPRDSASPTYSELFRQGKLPPAPEY